MLAVAIAWATVLPSAAHERAEPAASQRSAPPSATAPRVACPSGSAAPFADREQIAAVHRDAVDCLWQLGVIDGRPEADDQVVFDPGATTTRGQFAAMLHGLLLATGHAERLTEVQHPRYLDVPESHRFDRAVHALAANGIVAGIDDVTFEPDAPVRRDQAASLLLRAAAWSTGRELAPAAGPYFADVRAGTHRAAVDAGFELGMITGDRRPCTPAGGGPGGVFAPLDGLQRQHAAALLVRLMQTSAAIATGEPDPEQPDPSCPPPVWEPDLEAAIAYAATRPGRTRIAALGTDGEVVGYRSAETVPAASVIKVMFLAAYLDHPSVRDRALTRDDLDLLEPMIQRSTNEPATHIADLVGPDALRRLAERAGMQDFSYTRPWGLSQISARDQARFVVEVERYVPSRHQDTLLGLLEGVVPEQRWGLDGVEPTWNAHLKGGWGSGTGAVNHQIVMLRHDEGARVALAVLVTDSPSHEQGTTTLDGVVRRVLDDLPAR